MATYPLALAGHVATELLLGDALLVRELQYGSQRAAAASVAFGWLASLIWVAGIWLALFAMRRWLGRIYAPAVGALAGALVVAAAIGAGVPSVLAWLLLSAYLLGYVGAWAARHGEPA
jgi:hypothetical protein